MTCINCQYYWCWICGTEIPATCCKGWTHYLNIVFAGSKKNEILCEITNSVAFGFGNKCNLHWIIRTILMVLLICVMPIIYSIIFTSFSMVFFWNVCFKCIPKFRNMKSFITKFLLGLFNFVLFSITLCISIVIGAIFESIMIGP